MYGTTTIALSHPKEAHGQRVNVVCGRVSVNQNARIRATFINHLHSNEDYG